VAALSKHSFEATDPTDASGHDVLLRALLARGAHACDPPNTLADQELAGRPRETASKVADGDWAMASSVSCRRRRLALEMSKRRIAGGLLFLPPDTTSVRMQDNQ
jgi:hypothetical protein